MAEHTPPPYGPGPDAHPDPDTHPDLDRLADLDEGLLSAPDTNRLEQHVRGCAGCAERRAALRSVTTVLVSAPTAVMPAPVRTRLDQVLAQEQGRRVARVDRRIGPITRRRLDRVDAGPGEGPARNVRWLRTALVAAVAAGVVGFGGYALSSALGLSGPVAGRPVQIASTDLASAAGTVAADRDLDSYLFSPTWRCASRVVRGRITGLVPAVVDGRPSLLVYADGKDGRSVTVVSGCPGTLPSAGPSAELTG